MAKAKIITAIIFIVFLYCSLILIVNLKHLGDPRSTNYIIVAGITGIYLLLIGTIYLYRGICDMIRNDSSTSEM
jgi:hypothetical protein